MSTETGTQADASDVIARQESLARQVLRAEAQAIERLDVGQGFHDAVELILRHIGAPNSGPGPASGGGTLVVSGLGKSGIIGRKLSATFASTGTPSHFMHPAEAFHGDLGRVRQHDVVLLLSYGGATEEVVTLAGHLKQDNVKMIGMVRSAGTHLGRLVTVPLELGDITEACPLNVAPTASTTAMLAMGDALAMCVAQRRAFGMDDFHRYHPGGNLGRELTPVVQIMRFKVGENLPLIPMDKTVSEALTLATTSLPNLRRAGAMLIVDRAGKLAGIFTDGDLVRLLLHDADAMGRPIQEVMVADPRRLDDTAIVRDAVHMIRDHRIDELPVVNRQGEPLGLLDVQDLMTMKVIE